MWGWHGKSANNYDLTDIKLTNKEPSELKETETEIKVSQKFAFRHQEQIKQTAAQTNKYQTHQRHQNGGRLTRPKATVTSINRPNNSRTMPPKTATTTTTGNDSNEMLQLHCASLSGTQSPLLSRVGKPKEKYRQDGGRGVRKEGLSQGASVKVRKAVLAYFSHKIHGLSFY